MTVDELQRMMVSVPAPEVAPVDEAIIEGSVRYLGSEAAVRSVEADPYWPKWDSPWWHMLLLYELGEARRIPGPIVERMIGRMNALPLKIFPIRDEDCPPGTDPYRDSACHCELGCLHQVLTACGVDVGQALPWVEPWFPRYQMEDGGANCDGTAYLSGECASSMVATIAPFEAMLGREERFVERAAAFLVGRRLMEGSSSRHNAEEREAAAAWRRPCFPRFYFYDVLRGLAALVRWAEVHHRTLPLEAVAGVVEHLVRTFPDGAVRLGRRGFEGWPTMERVGGAWVRGRTASMFPLLEAVSEVGRTCPVLTRQWIEARRGLMRLVEGGRIAG